MSSAREHSASNVTDGEIVSSRVFALAANEQKSPGRPDSESESASSRRPYT